MTEVDKVVPEDTAGEVIKGDEKPTIEEPIKNWIFYFYPGNLTKIMNRRYGLFGGVTMIYYII